MINQLRNDRFAQVLLALVAIAAIFGCVAIVGAIIYFSAPQQAGPAGAPPEAPQEAPASFTLSGQGQQATELFPLQAGLVRFEINHDGAGHFGIVLLDDQGKTIALLINQVGPFSGSKAVTIRQSGQYLLDISASGQWTVRVSN